MLAEAQADLSSGGESPILPVALRSGERSVFRLARTACRAVEDCISRNKIAGFELFFKLPIFLCVLGVGNSYSQTNSELLLKLEKRDLGVATVCPNHAKADTPVLAQAPPSDIIAPPLRSSRQEMLDRAKYWENNGRSDFAAKIRNQLKLTEQKNAVAELGNDASACSNSFAITEHSAATMRITLKSAIALQSQSETPENTPVAAGGVKQPRQEQLDRAKYWENRGRSDLVEKIHNQLKLAEPKNSDVALGREAAVGNIAVAVTAHSDSQERARVKNSINLQSQSGIPENAPVLAGGVGQSKSEQLDRAKYWESRGRSDLAEKIHNQLTLAQIKDAGVASGRNATVGNSAAAITAHSGSTGKDFIASKSFPSLSENAPPLAPNLKPSRLELDDRARYWEVHGRNDLANQIRQKIQALTSPGAATAPLRKSGEIVQAQPLRPGKNQDNQNDASSARAGELLNNTQNMDTRLDRAQIYRSAGEFAKARAQIESVLSVSPDLPDALYASAQLYAEQGLWMETLYTLDRVLPVSRTPDMISLQKTAWAHVQIDRADALVRQGRNSEAEILLRQVALELSINLNQTPLAEPPPLWKNVMPGKRNVNH